MKARTQEFKNAMKGVKEIDAIITYTINNVEYELSSEQLNSIQPHYEGAILKSVMKELDLDSNVEIPNETIINLQFGVKVRYDDYDEDTPGAYRINYDYIDFGNYVVYSSEKQEDTNSYLIKCYDKMIYSMKDYESFGVTYPITIQNYLSALCTHLGLTLKSSNFTNYNKQLEKELYLDENGKSLGYTFRDVLDEIAQVTASTICINENDDELEVRYLNDTSNKNLFDEKTAKTTGTTGNFSTLMTIQLEPNTQYTFTRYVRTNFARDGGYYLYFVTNEDTSTRIFDLMYSTMSNPIASGHSTITTGSSGIIKLIGVYATNQRVSTYFENVNVQIEKGTQSTYYEPYGMDLIDEEFFDENNVNFGEVYGPINTVILSRSAESDEIAKSIPSNLSDDDKIAIKISENQILNFDNREEYLDNILNRLYGLTYTQNNFSSKGICYYNLCDKYACSIFGKIYNCVMLNDDIIIESSLSENVSTEIPETAETDYSKTSDSDKMVRRTTLIVDKQVGEISGEISTMNDQLNGANGITSKLTTQGQTIDLWSKSFDDNGNVVALNTTNYTFDNEGLKIGKSTDDYNSLQDNTGTYYYEKDTMIGKYTKDGSVQKDLALFGRYYYGMDETLNVSTFTVAKAKFVAQWYNDGTEEGFGHFWNGE